jgi:hypothetical protein
VATGLTGATVRTAARGPVAASATAGPVPAATAVRGPVAASATAGPVPAVRAVTRTVPAQAPPTAARAPVVPVLLARVPAVRGRAR